MGRPPHSNGEQVMRGFTHVRSELSRRSLFGGGAAAALSAASYRRVLGANDRVGLGFIGFGLIGKRHVLDFKDQAGRASRRPSPRPTAAAATKVLRSPAGRAGYRRLSRRFSMTARSTRWSFRRPTTGTR